MTAVAESSMGSGDGFGRREPPHRRTGQEEAEYRRDVRELVDLLSKLNPSAKEFVPSAYSPNAVGNGGGRISHGQLSADAPLFVASPGYYISDPTSENNGYINFGTPSADSASSGSSNNQLYRRRRNAYYQGRRRLNERIPRAEKEDCIKRTVYVSDIDQHVTEQELAVLFGTCGQVLDCRVCGDPHSVLRFAFIEFANEHAAREALNLSGTMLGFYPVKVLPSKTAILPVNPSFLPQSEDEWNMCARTVYCTNIDKKVTQTEVKEFFESTCGEVSRLRLLGDHVHSTRIAFVEFVVADSATLALNCSGMMLGALPIRVSPSKTPVRPRAPRANSH